MLVKLRPKHFLFAKKIVTATMGVREGLIRLRPAKNSMFLDFNEKQNILLFLMEIVCFTTLIPGIVLP
jgi:hypothetical protein